jgi:hypothetical protein
MYRELEKPDVLAGRKDAKVVKTLLDDISGTKVHYLLVHGCYEIVMEPPQPGPMPAVPVTKINAELFRALRSLPIPKEE